MAGGLLLAGCSGTTSSAGAPTQITFQYLWTGVNGNRIQSLIDKFNASQKEIVVKGVANSDPVKQLASMSSSTPAFDISDTYGDQTQSWAAKGILAPLDDYLKSGIDLSDFVPAAMEQQKYKGKYYSLPFALQSNKLIYNKDLFAKAGIDAPPATFTDLTADIAKLTVTGENGDIKQLGLGWSDNAGGLAYTMETLGIAGGGHWDTSEGVTPNDPKIVAALSAYQKDVVDAYGAGAVAKFMGGFGQYTTSEDPFYTGKLAMIIDGEFQSDHIARTAPTLNWGVADVPVASASDAGASLVYSSTLFIPSNSQHKEQAATFIKYMESSNSMKEFTSTAANLPALVSLAGSPAYNSPALPNFGVWLSALPSDKLQTMGTDPNLLDYESMLKTAFQKIMLGTQSAQEAMDSVAASMKAKYGD
jgi:multiple sugar transport system substrate-binding protein